ncbi:MAG: glycoside hydrolase [Elusimicrobia bacterium A5]|nr:MAG: glycoside hydrolase [Elusimicrobia bacterium A5]
MSRYVCIHGHFYQPPRENSWLGDVELQDSAYPYHDWNDRITAECYAPNTASRTLNNEQKIIYISNNFSKISFNFGPTLLSWMENHEPEVYKAIIDADKESQKKFSGHGSAIAQVYNHIIMPLANEKDKRTQIFWGIKDFEYRFKRKPEGMWLAETAVDIETLEILAEFGIKFTILAPRQSKRVRKLGVKDWVDVGNSNIDPKRAYLCNLPSGRKINLFFYDGPIAQDLAFGGQLNTGENFTDRLMSAFTPDNNSQIVHIATDGETYGHHKRYGDMTLAYCLYYIEANNLAKLTVYGEYLEKHPPNYEVEIFENSSWSCIHGVERWRNNCGCNSGMHGGWKQDWRAPLRNAFDWLRDAIIPVYENEMKKYVKDPWQARDNYIEVMLDNKEKTLEQFISTNANHSLSEVEKNRMLRLLEMQKFAMYMYTSCGWFFDELSGIETVQVIQYAARAIHIAKETVGLDLEEEFTKLLEKAPSNIPNYKNGAKIYELFVKPAVVDLVRVGAHYAISSLFKEYPEEIKIYSYIAKSESYDLFEMGKQRLAVGKAKIHSDITKEDGIISFAVLHLGDHNLTGGVRKFIDDESFTVMRKEIEEIFKKGDIPGVIRLMDSHFGSHNYSLWHLFKDEQRKIIGQILEATLQETESLFRQIYENHYPIARVLKDMGIPLPKAIHFAISFILNTDIKKALKKENIDFEIMRKLVDEIKQWQIEIDKDTVGYIAERKIEQWIRIFSEEYEEMSVMDALDKTIAMLTEISVPLDLWKTQNIYFEISRKKYPQMKLKKEQGDDTAGQWVEKFRTLGKSLGVAA